MWIHSYEVCEIAFLILSLIFCCRQGSSPSKDLLSTISRSLNHQSVDVRRIVSIVAGHVAWTNEEAMSVDELKVFSGTK